MNDKSHSGVANSPIQRVSKWRRRILVSSSKQIRAVSIVTLGVLGLVLGARQLGGLQPAELAIYDLMVRLRPDEAVDNRLLVVGVTEQDIQRRKEYPLSDATLSAVLEKLETYQPRAIGIDILRDVPQGKGREALIKQLEQNDNIIAVCKLSSADQPGIPAAPGVPDERVGFADLPIDAGGTLRRSLLLSTPIASKLPVPEQHLCNDPAPDNQILSLDLLLALVYLEPMNIELQLTPSGQLQLGSTVFKRLDKHAGGYQNADVGNYQLMLNYRSANNAIPQVSITEVLEGKLDPALVKDRIVLVGYTASIVKDDFYTPYSGGAIDNQKMPGVVAHAQNVSQILSAVLDDRPLLTYWPEWAEILWIAGSVVASIILVARIHNPLVLGISSLVALGVLFGFGVVLFMQGVWIPLIAPSLALLITGGAIVTYQLQQAKQEEQMVMKLLGQQTSPEIAKALWSERNHLLEDGRLPGQRLIATMLITDIQGFSTISEKESPEVVMAWLNEYLAALTQEVQNHQGIINKFTGDGVLAVFGVPVPRTTPAEIAEDARRAVACGLAMNERLPELNRNWTERGLPPVKMRVGIFTGPVMVGSLGGKERLEYGVIGDSVNIASRLESCEKERQPGLCRILIANETLVHIQEHFQVEPWGPIPLKGKQQVVDVYHVVGYQS